MADTHHMLYMCESLHRSPNLSTAEQGGSQMQGHSSTQMLWPESCSKSITRLVWRRRLQQAARPAPLCSAVATSGTLYQATKQSGRCWQRQRHRNQVRCQHVLSSALLQD